MKNLFIKNFRVAIILLVLSLASSCHKGDNVSVNLENPVENTKWTIDYGGFFVKNENSPNYTNGDLPKESDLFNYLVTSKYGESNLILSDGSVNTTDDFVYFPDLYSGFTAYLSFNVVPKSGGSIGKADEIVQFNGFFNGDYCSEESLNYNYDTKTLGSNGIKYYISSVRTDELFTYKTLADGFIFTAYKLTTITPASCPSTSTDTPNTDFLNATWNVVGKYNDGQVSLEGNFVITSNFQKQGDNAYYLRGKFNEVYNGQTTEYTIDETRSSYLFTSGLINIVASDGTTEYIFSGQLDNSDGKIKGIKGESSITINTDPIGNFTASKQ